MKYLPSVLALLVVACFVAASSITVTPSPNHVAGDLEVSGNITITDTVWDDMTVSTLSLSAGAAAPEPTAYGTNSIKSLNYDSGDSSYGQIQFSHAKKPLTDVNPHIHWSSTDDRSAITNISFKLDCVYGGINRGITNTYSSTVTVTGTNAYLHRLVSFTPFGSNALNESSIVLFEITCVEDGGANDKVFIHDIDFHYQIDKLGSDNEIPDGI